MSTTVTYKGSTIATVDNATKTLLTSGKYCEDDITLVDVSGGGGDTILYANGANANATTLYAENTIIDSTACTTNVFGKMKNAAKLKTVKCLRSEAYGGSSLQLASAFSGCSLLESVQFLNGFSTSGYVENIIKDCPNIKEFIVGDIGYPNTSAMGSTNASYYLFKDLTIAFDIIIYTTATSIADVPSALKTGSPWGATNATVIYKNSVTGEVLT